MTSKYTHVSTNNLVFGTNSNGRVKIPELMKGDYRFEMFTTTNLIYNVSSLNNNFSIVYFDGGSNLYDIVLTPGNYSYLDLANEIETQLNATVVGGSFTVDYDTISGKYTITEAANTFYFIFVVVNSAYKLMGFNYENQSNLEASKTSDNPSQIYPNQVIYLRLGEDDDLNIRGSSSFSSSLFIPVNSEFGEKFDYKINTESLCQIIRLNSTSGLTFRFHDSNRKDIDLNGADWEILLKNVSN